MVNKKIFFLNVLNVISCYCVILLHCNGNVWQFDPSKHWVFQWFIETFFYWPVPIFVMISGVTLMDYRDKYSTKEYAIKRIKKVIIPFILWTLIAMMWASYYLHSFKIEYILDVRNIFDNLINTRVLSIYYFFPQIFIVYALIPFVSLIPKEKRNKAFLYLLIYQVISCDLVYFLCLALGISYNPGISNSFTGYILFAMLGWILYNNNITGKQRAVIYIFGIIGWGLRFFADGLRSFNSGMVNSIYGEYIRVNCMFMAASVFLIFKNINWSKIENSIVGRLINILSKTSYGIYLIHVYVMYYISDRFMVDTSSIKWVLIGSIAVYAVSASIVIIAKKIPLIKFLFQ